MTPSGSLVLQWHAMGLDGEMGLGGVDMGLDGASGKGSERLAELEAEATVKEE